MGAQELESRALEIARLSNFKSSRHRASYVEALLLPYQMIFIHIELVADVLVNLPVRQQNESTLEGMGFGEGFRIFGPVGAFSLPVLVPVEGGA